MVETYGYVGAIEAADVCLKAANVTLLGCEFVKGGLVTIHIRGDVGAVKASIDAAEAAVQKIGQLLSTHVIPRPSDDVEKILPMSSLAVSQKDHHSQEVDTKEVKSEEEITTSKLGASPKSREALNALKAVDLRALARKIDDQFEGAFSIERSQIKYTRKEELIEAILNFYKGVK